MVRFVVVVMAKREIVGVVIFCSAFVICFIIFDTLYFSLVYLYQKEDNYEEFVNPSQWWYLNENDTIPNCEDDDMSLYKKWKPPKLDGHLLIRTCTGLNKFWKFPTSPLSEEEKEYPLAFVINGKGNVRQTLRLFRAIYQPQNIYCINVDKNSSSVFNTSMNTLSKCLPNVIIPDTRRNLEPCSNSRLVATASCLRKLRHSAHQWKYVQILSGNDFPLKTNREMVQILKILNGTVDGSLRWPDWNDLFRYKGKSVMKYFPPPHIVEIFSSHFPMLLSKEFVNYAFTNKMARDLYKWFNKRTKCSEEMYFSTLVHNPYLKAPGSFPGSCVQFYDWWGNREQKQFISQYFIRLNDFEPEKCKGYFKDQYCVFGVEDLSNLKDQYSLVAHILEEHYEPAALFCMEQWHYQKIVDRVNLTDDMIQYYSNMPSVVYNALNDEDKCSFTCFVNKTDEN